MVDAWRGRKACMSWTTSQAGMGRLIRHITVSGTRTGTGAHLHGRNLIEWRWIVPWTGVANIVIMPGTLV